MNFVLKNCIKKYNEQINNKFDENEIKCNNNEPNKTNANTNANAFYSKSSIISKYDELINNKEINNNSNDSQNQHENINNKYDINKVNDVMTDFINKNMCFYMDKIHTVSKELDNVKIESKKKEEKLSKIKEMNEQNMKEYDKKINEIKELLLNNNKINFDISTKPNNIYFVDTTKDLQYIVPKGIKMMFLTMVGGGGAGGIGICSNQYFYSGGGGGSGACIIKKPIFVEENMVVYIKVGKGGVSNYGLNGEESYIKYCINNKENKIYVNGGKNGFPQYKFNDNLENLFELKVNGGFGGKTCYPYLCGKNGDDGQLIPTSGIQYDHNKCNYSHNYCGKDGKDGEISYPSGPAVCPGEGGCSLFYNGGNGGTNFFNIGGKCGNKYNLIGDDGEYGSGGGGSCPKYKINRNEKISGNGGNGIVILEIGSSH